MEAVSIWTLSSFCRTIGWVPLRLSLPSLSPCRSFLVSYVSGRPLVLPLVGGRRRLDTRSFLSQCSSSYQVVCPLVGSLFLSCISQTQTHHLPHCSVVLLVDALPFFLSFLSCFAKFYLPPNIPLASNTLPLNTCLLPYCFGFLGLGLLSCYLQSHIRCIVFPEIEGCSRRYKPFHERIQGCMDVEKLPPWYQVSSDLPPRG